MPRASKAPTQPNSAAETLEDARDKVLGEDIAHHLAGEENAIFPQCRASGLDLAQLGRLLALGKHERSVGFRVSSPILALS